jgi:pimeloyl-ACP methyl ester carboxylesterase
MALAVSWNIFSHNWALVSMGLMFSLLVLVPVFVLNKYIRIMLNIIKDTPPPLSMGPQDFEPLEGEQVNFRAFDGLSLRGMFLRGNPDMPDKGAIIFAHEFASDRLSCARYCRPLLKAGYDVFSFDFRAHGQSSPEENYQPRQWASDREVSDMVGAIAFVEDWLEQQHRPVRLGLFGISRGACAAILAAWNDPRVTTILCDGAFSSDTTLEYLMKRWAYIFAKVRFVYENHPPTFWRFLRWLLFLRCRRTLNCEFPSVRKALARMENKPVFFIHGECDSYVPSSQAEMLYALSDRPKYLWIVPAARHNEAVVVQPAQYAQRIVAFFDRHLAGCEIPDHLLDAPSFSELSQPLAYLDTARPPGAYRRRRNGPGQKRVPVQSRPDNGVR